MDLEWVDKMLQKLQLVIHCGTMWARQRSGSNDGTFNFRIDAGPQNNF